MTAHLYAQLSRHFSRADRIAFEQPDGKKYSYGEVARGAAAYAHALVALGVAPGDRVALQIEKSVAGVIMMLGCLRAGAVILPLNTAYTAAEVDYFLRDADPRVFVCDPARADVRQAAQAAGVARIETMAADGSGSMADRARLCPDAFPDVARGPDDLAAIVYTSGTTGRSKGAMLTQENLASNARTLVDCWRFTQEDALLHALPTYHVHGLFVAINTMLMAGGATLFLPAFDAEEIIRLMPRATTMMGVPTFYVRLLQHPGLTRAATHHMRLFISGSAPLLAETHRAFEERTGQAILERYGMTETGMNTTNPYDGPRLPGTVGPPLPGVSLRVSDPATGAPLPQGETGMIEVKGANVFAGYWRQPEKTRAEFRADGFFVTGDLGKIDAQGYVHIIGRARDLIITGGLNVYPKEVETVIDSVAGVAESAVIGVPHPEFGEGVTAVVTLQPGATVDEAAILAALADRLAKYKQPKRIVTVAQLPRNAMGKVQKNLLREAYAHLYQS